MHSVNLRKMKNNNNEKLETLMKILKRSVKQNSISDYIYLINLSSMATVILRKNNLKKWKRIEIKIDEALEKFKLQGKIRNKKILNKK